ncbi:hypothetical protein GGR54DRAFT_126329 [Hypoxylon sp. NC1633]|nr:hypothetical protein GGR54DRAFT_126329 [Hypoxylon sp. NC1633]
MILIILGGISSWKSLSRNREYFTSERLEGVRIRYFEHIAQAATDEPPPPKPKAKLQEEPNPITSAEFPDFQRESYFSVNSVRRAPKIEDEDDDSITEMKSTYTAGGTIFVSSPMKRAGRSASVSSRHPVSNLPRGARVHRASWSSRDFSHWQADQDRPDPKILRRISGGSGYIQADSASIMGGSQGRSSVNSSQAAGAPIPSTRPISPTREVVEKNSGKEVGDGRLVDSH